MYLLNVTLPTDTIVDSQGALRLELISKLVETHDLYFIPLHSFNKKTKTCTCNNQKCSSPGKHPYVKFNWKMIATNDLVKVSKYYTANPNINFGIATGRKSSISGKYLTVVDIDDTDHPILQTLPPTLSYKTGSGGFHYWYWSKYPVRNSVSGLASKVDIRGKDGYVVVPPSTHKSGNPYKFTSLSNAIADLPDFIVDFIKTKKPSITSLKITTEEKPKVDKKLYSLWSVMSVPQIRNLLKSPTAVIPSGVRNSVIHRLLSSDRTKGCEREELEILSQDYRLRCGNYDEITLDELQQIIGSVLKYEPFNTSHENVNDEFFKWKEVRGQKIDLETQTKISSLDEKFFSSLVKLPDLSPGIPLSLITSERTQFMQSSGLTSFSNYRPQLLAKKLESMGFSRSRTNKGNVWNISLLSLQQAQNMVSSIHSESRLSAVISNNPSIKNITNMTVKITDNTSIKYTRKNHPNERLYNGRPTMETMNAIMQALECLDDDEFEKLATGELIYDEESTAELFDSFEKGDVIGLCGMVEGKGWIPEQWTILDIDVEGDRLFAESRYEPKIEREIFFEDISVGLLLGRAEILLRDNKPYGLSDEDMEMKITILDLSKKPETVEVTPEVVAAPESTGPLSEEEATKNAIEEINKLAESLMKDSTPLEV